MDYQARLSHRIVESVRYDLERTLPDRGSIYAKLGDAVKPETVIGETKVSAGFRIFKLDELLKVRADKAGGYLHRTIGSRVYRGDVIAEAPHLLGLRKRQFLSPLDGVLQSFDPLTGRLTMRLAPSAYRLPAGVRGQVSQIVPDRSVFIEAEVSLLFGRYASGTAREGALQMVAKPDQVIEAAMIGPGQAGHVIAGGASIRVEALHRALAVGVKGVVTGGIAAEDLLAVSGELDGTEDVGLTLLVTAGLGVVPMEEATYAFLERYQQQQVFIVPKENMLVVPLPLDSQGKAKTLVSLPEEYGLVAVGDTARILSAPAAGQIGIIEKLLEPAISSYTRLAVSRCLLRLSTGDTIELPITNIEIMAGSGSKGK